MIDENDFRARIGQIEALTAEVEALPDQRSREKAIKLVELLMDYHGAAVERVIEIVAESDAGEKIFQRVANDELASSLLLLYGLHPLTIEERVGRAVEKTRSVLASSGGDAEIVDVIDGVVRVRLTSGRNGCASSSDTLKHTIEQAIYDAAPDVVAIEIEEGGKARPNNLVQIQGVRQAVAA